MFNTNQSESSFDRTVRSLCKEIDALKQENVAIKEKCKKEVDYIKALLEQTYNNRDALLSNLISLFLSVQEDGKGNLIIDKDKRKMLLNMIDSSYTREEAQKLKTKIQEHDNRLSIYNFFLKR